MIEICAKCNPADVDLSMVGTLAPLTAIVVAVALGWLKLARNPWGVVGAMLVGNALTILYTGYLSVPSFMTGTMVAVSASGGYSWVKAFVEGATVKSEAPEGKSDGAV